MYNAMFNFTGGYYAFPVPLRLIPIRSGLCNSYFSISIYNNPIAC